MSERPTSWELYQLLYLYSLFYYYHVYVAVRTVRRSADGAAMAVCRPMKPESCSQVLSGEGFQLRCYGPAQTGGPDHIACRNCRHGKLLISIAPVPRAPAPSQAGLLLNPLGFLQLCTPQFHQVHHHLPTPLTALQKILSRMPPKNGPPENGECCSNMGNCDQCCQMAPLCDCINGRASSSTSSPPPPPPLQPPPTPAPSQSRFRHIICLPPAVPMEEDDTSCSPGQPPCCNMLCTTHWDPIDRHAFVPNRGDSRPPRPPTPPPRDMSRSPRRSRTRSRSRSMVRAGRRHSKDDDSVTEAARIVVTRVWKHAERDRRVLEDKLENQGNRMIAKFQIGHKQGVAAAQRLHNSYVLPQNLAPTFLAGFLACLIGVLTGLVIMWNLRSFF